MKLIQRLAFRCLMLSGLAVLVCGDAFCQDSSLLRVSNPGTRVPVTLPAMQGNGAMQLTAPVVAPQGSSQIRAGGIGQAPMQLANVMQVPQPPAPGLVDGRQGTTQFSDPDQAGIAGQSGIPNQLRNPGQRLPNTGQLNVPGLIYPGSAPVMLNDASWTYQPAPPLRVFQKQDVVTIRVDEITRVMAEGNIDNRKRTLFDAIVNDWIRIVNFRFIPQPMIEGQPGVAFQSQSNYRADASVESRESMTFNIAATVVDIRPNGNLVLEARKHIRINDNLWETSLTGICRAIDIGPDNVVLSKDLIDLEIRKEDQGQLRDGTSRGWVQRWVDRFGPF